MTLNDAHSKFLSRLDDYPLADLPGADEAHPPKPPRPPLNPAGVLAKPEPFVLQIAPTDLAAIIAASARSVLGYRAALGQLAGHGDLDGIAREVGNNAAQAIICAAEVEANGALRVDPAPKPTAPGESDQSAVYAEGKGNLNLRLTDGTFRK